MIFLISYSTSPPSKRSRNPSFTHFLSFFPSFLLLSWWMAYTCAPNSTFLLTTEKGHIDLAMYVLQHTSIRYFTNMHANTQPTTITTIATYQRRIKCSTPFHSTERSFAPRNTRKRARACESIARTQGGGGIDITKDFHTIITQRSGARTRAGRNE
ncbi:hypothetical protein DM02DRAFT_304029 [Periconia macrospinosa]|uniref:Uncharacterized protein n=1 Tax=Periconia macrospinosa TaxID=97972 RepID=A0A2V1DWH0_9PLEO|nr:hypothetical protein DM02DRAFT_304029 [Periconia macrospinosa]